MERERRNNLELGQELISELICEVFVSDFDGFDGRFLVFEFGFVRGPFGILITFLILRVAPHNFASSS